jgi:hypothetical protein
LSIEASAAACLSAAQAVDTESSEKMMAVVAVRRGQTGDGRVVRFICALQS